MDYKVVNFFEDFSPSFIFLLTVLFIILKLTGIVTWSWLFVLAPAWIWGVVLTSAITIILIAVLVVEWTTKRIRK